MQDPAPDQLNSLDQCVAVARRLFAEAFDTFERRMLVLSGERALVQSSAFMIWQAHSTRVRLWVGEKFAGVEQTLLATQAVKTLGSEHQLIVFDAWSGFHPDAFCALMGTLVGGGVLVLLTPPLPQWQHFADPDYQRMVPYGYSPADVSGRFLRHVWQGFRQCAAIVCVDAPCSTAIPVVPSLTVPHHQTETACLQQVQRLDALECLAGQPPVPVVITADRGRGKSAMLGRLAARWSLRMRLRVAVTAASPLAATQARRWAQQEATHLGSAAYSLTYIAPDALLAEDQPLDALLIDEAAMLPITLLQQLVQRYPRIVLASTVHGYEGSGRGLAVKLMPWLDRETPGWQAMVLNLPMRWSENDPLEQWLANIFCLSDDYPLEVPNSDRWQVRLLAKDELAENPDVLHRAFGLLMSAHYRTTPSDLRDLLDGPNLSLWLMEMGSQIIGVCLVAREGPLADAALCDAILAGKRRPRGHLLPQTMAFHCHSPLALSFRCARIVRIAIAPPLQGLGWGARLVASVEAALVAEGIQIIGTSFALEAAVLRFWRRTGMGVLRVGATRESASGLPSCLMAKALARPMVNQTQASTPNASDEGTEARIYADELHQLEMQFSREAKTVLPVITPTLSQDVQAQLVNDTRPMDAVSLARLRARVQRFAVGALPFESALGALQQWSLSVGRLCEEGAAAEGSVNEVLFGQLTLKGFAQRHSLNGREAVIERLREIFAASLATERHLGGS